MNKIYFIIVLFVAAIFTGCSKDETDGLPSVDVGAVANLIKDATTDANLPPDDLATMNVAFDVDVVAEDEVSKVEITADFNDGEVTGVYQVLGTDKGKIEVTLAGILDALPTLAEADIVKGSMVSFYVTEIVMADGRVFNNDSILTDQTKLVQEKINKVLQWEDVAKTIPKMVSVPVYIKPANLTGDFTTPSAVFNIKVNYFVACPSDIEGKYTLTFTGKGGGGVGALEDYNVTIEGVTIDRISPIEYRVSNSMGSLMEHYYSAYGGATIKGNFLDICGEFKPSAAISNGWHANTYTNGVVAADGVITIEVKNNWGDNGTMVYTPVN